MHFHSTWLREDISNQRQESEGKGEAFESPYEWTLLSYSHVKGGKTPLQISIEVLKISFGEIFL